MNYYNQVNHLIKKLEVNKKARYLKDNRETLLTYWHIGKLLVEAQGGEKRAKYGDELIKEWSVKLTSIYGNGYKETNLKYFRQYYLMFKKGHTVYDQLTWSHIKIILPLKTENKINYYINLCIERNLSVRELQSEIKNNAYERLLVKPERIEIIKKERKDYDIRNNIRNPIIIKLEKYEYVTKEKDLQLLILAKLKNFFQELGQGFAFIGNEYKITCDNKDYFIDILLFNYKLNCFVVVELKLRKLEKEDKAQIMFYMEAINQSLKEEFHHKTIGIIVSKEQDEFIMNFVSEEDIITVNYELIKL